MYPGKQITLLHSRNQLLPRFDEAMHNEGNLILYLLSHSIFYTNSLASSATQRIKEANIALILGKRLDLSSVSEVPARRNSAGQRIVKTEAGDEIAADLIVSPLFQAPHSHQRLAHASIVLTYVDSFCALGRSLTPSCSQRWTRRRLSRVVDRLEFSGACSSPPYHPLIWARLLAMSSLPPRKLSRHIPTSSQSGTLRMHSVLSKLDIPHTTRFVGAIRAW